MEIVRLDLDALVTCMRRSSENLTGDIVATVFGSVDAINSRYSLTVFAEAGRKGRYAARR
jgi:hypothetical protein